MMHCFSATFSFSCLLLSSNFSSIIEILKWAALKLNAIVFQFNSLMLLHIDKNGLNFNLQVEEKEGQGKNERGLLSDDGVGTFL